MKDPLDRNVEASPQTAAAMRRYENAEANAQGADRAYESAKQDLDHASTRLNQAQQARNDGEIVGRDEDAADAEIAELMGARDQAAARVSSTESARDTAHTRRDEALEAAADSARVDAHEASAAADPASPDPSASDSSPGGAAGTGQGTDDAFRPIPNPPAHGDGFTPGPSESPEEPRDADPGPDVPEYI